MQTFIYPYVYYYCGGEKVETDIVKDGRFVSVYIEAADIWELVDVDVAEDVYIYDICADFDAETGKFDFPDFWEVFTAEFRGSLALYNELYEAAYSAAVSA